jgi:hypothetical protein
VLDILVQPRRNKKAAKKFFREFFLASLDRKLTNLYDARALPLEPVDRYSWKSLVSLK